MESQERKCYKKKKYPFDPQNGTPRKGFPLDPKKVKLVDEIPNVYFKEERCYPKE